VSDALWLPVSLVPVGFMLLCVGSPMNTTCPNCKLTGMTDVDYEVGCGTWAAAGVIGLFCWFGCCLIPFFIDNYKVCPPPPAVVLP
jgi:hypothetical protein